LHTRHANWSFLLGLQDIKKRICESWVFFGLHEYGQLVALRGSGAGCLRPSGRVLHDDEHPCRDPGSRQCDLAIPRHPFWAMKCAGQSETGGTKTQPNAEAEKLGLCCWQDCGGWSVVSGKASVLKSFQQKARAEGGLVRSTQVVKQRLDERNTKSW
jgi:hypothetical protein